ncbi:hypothetical protein C2S51_017980 [Perilla frutescens var. frutescens]|nr:hypothetical protein C2S51_017980 [Perilla frutescens var. frutescens]
MKTRSTQPHVDPVPNSPDRAHRQRNKERRRQEAEMAANNENNDVEALIRRLREMEQRLARQAAPEQEAAPLNQLYRAPTDSGLTNNTKRLVDTSAGGCLVNRTASEALRIIEEMAATSYQWPMERRQTRPAAAVSDSRMDELRAEIEDLKKQVLGERRAHMDVNAVQQQGSESSDVEGVNFVNQRNYNSGNYNRGQQGFQSNNMAYHPSNMNHLNFSYANPNNALQPPGFATPTAGPSEPKKPSLEEMMGQLIANQNSFIGATGTKITQIEGTVSALSKQLNMLEVQVGQMTNNSSTQHKPATEVPPTPAPKVAPATTAAQTVPTSSTAPFPTRLAKAKTEQKMEKFMEILKKVNINIPLLDALRDMPGYAKFLKDVVSKKRKLGKFETVNLSEECNAVLQRKLPLKQKDPGSFTIACVIGGRTFEYLAVLYSMQGLQQEPVQYLDIRDPPQEGTVEKKTPVANMDESEARPTLQHSPHSTTRAPYVYGREVFRHGAHDQCFSTSPALGSCKVMRRREKFSDTGRASLPSHRSSRVAVKKIAFCLSMSRGEHEPCFLHIPRAQILMAPRVHRAGRVADKNDPRYYGVTLHDPQHVEKGTKLAQLNFVPSRWITRAVLETLGLFDDVQTLCGDIRVFAALTGGWPSYRQLMLEFLSTVNVVKSKKPVRPTGITFQLDNRPHELSCAHLCELFHCPQGEYEEHEDYNRDVFRQMISQARESPFNPKNDKDSSIKNPVFRLIHRAVARTHMVIHLGRSSTKANGTLTCGGIITRIAQGCGINLSEMQPVEGYAELGLDALLHMNFLKIDQNRHSYFVRYLVADFPLPNRALNRVATWAECTNWTMSTVTHLRAIEEHPPVLPFRIFLNIFSSPEAEGPVPYVEGDSGVATPVPQEEEPIDIPLPSRRRR